MMSNVYDLLDKLHEYRAEIEATLDPAEFAEFETRRVELGRLSEGATDDDPQQAALTEEALAILKEHPAIETILRQHEPGLLPTPTPAPASGPSPVSTPTPPSGQPPTTSPAPPPGPSPVSTPTAPSAQPAATPAASPPGPPPAATPTPAADRKWTPDLDIQLFKEIVTALIGVIVIGFTVYLALRSVNVAGDEAKSADAQHILTLMLGLAGVVLGYYFGRIPAEAQATQARKEASTAAAGAEAVGIKGEALASEVDRVLASPAATRAGAPAPDVEGMRQARDEFRASLRALTRR